jgi:hypothetical protein
MASNITEKALDVVSENSAALGAAQVVLAQAVADRDEAVRLLARATAVLERHEREAPVKASAGAESALAEYVRSPAGKVGLTFLLLALLCLALALAILVGVDPTLIRELVR